MKITFIGGTNFIGHAAAKAAVARDHEVSVIHRGEHPAEVEGVRSVLADRNEVEALTAALEGERPEIVVDTRAMTRLDIQTTLAALRSLQPALVVLSSHDVYAQFGRLLGHDGPDPEALVTEASPLTVPYPFKGIDSHAGGDAYDKKDVEAELRAATASGLPSATVLRLPATYGSRDPQRRFASVVDALDRGDHRFPHQNQAAFRWTHGHVDNVAHAIVLAAEARLAGFQLFNVGEATTPTMRERAELIAQLMGKDIEWRESEEKLTDAWQIFGEMPNDVIVSSDLIRDKLGYREPLSEEACLLDLIEGLRRSRKE